MSAWLQPYRLIHAWHKPSQFEDRAWPGQAFYCLIRLLSPLGKHSINYPHDLFRLGWVRVLAFYYLIQAGPSAKTCCTHLRVGWVKVSQCGPTHEHPSTAAYPKTWWTLDKKESDSKWLKYLDDSGLANLWFNGYDDQVYGLPTYGTISSTCQWLKWVQLIHCLSL